MNKVTKIEKIKESEIEIIENDYSKQGFGSEEMVARANSYISAKSSSTLLESKIFALATKRAVADKNGKLSLHIKAAELRSLMDVKGNGFYDHLKTAANLMGNRFLFIEDVDNEEFAYINILTSATFKSGVFTINFNPEITPWIRNLKDSYTKMSLQTLFSFKSIYSFRCYENLKIHMYKIGKDNQPYAVEYGLSELKFALNLIKTEDINVKRELQKKKPDYDKIVSEMIEKEPYAEWFAFKKYVIEKAIKEINEKTEMYVQYKTVRNGKGGKVTKVIFYIQRNEDTKKNKTEKNQEKKKKENLIQAVIDMMDAAPITKKDASLLLKTAENDLDKIEKAYRLALKQEYIKNFMGWMIDCIKNGYDDQIEMLDGSVERAEKVNQVLIDYKKADKEKMAAELWEKTKKNDYFPLFRDYIYKEFGMDELMMEDIYTAEERFKMYVDWKQEYNRLVRLSEIT